MAALCGLILPDKRDSAEGPAYSAELLRKFVAQVRSAELVSFEVEKWEPAVEHYGGNSVALVRTKVRYNEIPEPASFRTIWVCVGGEWYTTATGKFWLDYTAQH